MPVGVFRRGGRYSLRRRVPVDLVEHYGKAEIVQALGTSDPREAKERAVLRWASLDREFRRLREARKPSAMTGEGGVKGRPDRFSTMTREQFEFELAGYEEDAAWEMEEAAGYAARSEVRAKLEALLSSNPDQLTTEQQALRDLLADHKFEATVAKERLTAQTLQPPAPKADPSPPVDGPTLSELVSPWAREREVTPKAEADHRSVARWFEDRMGTMPLSGITRRDVIEFKNKLREEGQTLRNIKVKLSRLRTLFGYAVANDFRADNPAQGVTVAIKDAEQTRRSYDPASLKQLFTGPVHSQDARPSGGRGEAAYWLPLLALYTGARLEELGQLRTQDVQFKTFSGEDDREETAWFLHITRDDDDGLKLKNAGSERVVPVHTTLEECGFSRFVQDRLADGERRLFPELKPDKYGRVTAKWGEWFSSYRRDTCGIADPRLVFHSFRHTFKDCARHVGINECVQRQIMGHSGDDVASNYGSGYSLHQLVLGMRMYRVAGFVPPSPPPAYRDRLAVPSHIHAVE